MNLKFYQIVTAVCCAVVISSAYADKSTGSSTLAIEDAKVNMAQAVTAAEKFVGGNAVHAEYEHHKDGSTFDVEVAKDKKIIKVKIDPMSGKVISSVEDKDDEHHKVY